MKTTLNILLTAALLMLAVGCDSGSRKQSVQLRWEETMDEVRLQAARQSLAEGRYDYAQRVLEPCKNKDAEKLMAEIKAARQMFAQLSTARDGIDRSY